MPTNPRYYKSSVKQRSKIMTHLRHELGDKLLVEFLIDTLSTNNSSNISVVEFPALAQVWLRAKAAKLRFPVTEDKVNDNGFGKLTLRKRSFPL